MPSILPALAEKTRDTSIGALQVGTGCERPHRALELRPPEPKPQPAAGEIHRRDRLGGLIHEYNKAAA